MSAGVFAQEEGRRRGVGGSAVGLTPRLPYVTLFRMPTVTIRLPKGCTDGIVAMRSISDRRVVAHGRTVKTVIKKAARAGATAPALMFVPRIDTRYVY